MRIAKRRLVATCVGLALVQGGLRSARGQSIWTDSTGNVDWNTASNWNPSGVPNSSGATVEFLNPGSGQVNISSNASAGTLYFDSSASLYTLTSSAGVALSGVSTIVQGPDDSQATHIQLANIANGSLLFNGSGNLTITNSSLLQPIFIDSSTVIGTSGNGGVIVNGAGATVFGGSFTAYGNLFVAGGLTKTGPGLLDFTGSGANLQDGITLNGGALNLDYSSSTAAKLGAGSLTLDGGVLLLTANSGTPVTSAIPSGTLVVNAGQTDVIASGTGTIKLFTTTISRTAGATVDFSPTSSGPAFSINTSSGNTNSLLGTGTAYATINSGSTWATVSGGQVIGLTTYGTNTYGSGTNTDVTVSNTSSGFTTNSLRFNSSSTAPTITLNGNATIQSGGILVTPNSIGGTISGLSLVPSGGELVVAQYSSSPFTISSSIQTTVGLTKSGPGTLILTNALDSLTLKGTVNINRGNLTITDPGVLGAATSLDFNDDESGAGLQQFTAQFLNGSSNTISVPIRLSAYSSASSQLSYGTYVTTGNASNSSVTLSGVISSAPGQTTSLLFYNGLDDNSSGFNLTATNTFTGNISLFSGFLGINSDASLGNAANVLTLNVDSYSNGGLVFLNSGINVAHSIALYPAIPTRVVSNGTDSNTISGLISGSGILVKGGTGTLTLTNTGNTMSGGVIVNAGTLSIGSTSALGSGPIILNGGTLSYTGATGLLNNQVELQAAGTIAISSATTNLTTANVTSNIGSALTVAGPGQLTTTNSGSAYGSLTLTNNGTLSTSFPAVDLQVLTFDAGTLQYTGGNLNVFNLVVNVTGNGGTIPISSASTTLTLGGVLNGPSGALYMPGPGTLNLALSNSSSNTLASLSPTGGTTQISSGTLTLFAGGGGSSVFPRNGAVLNISGGAVVNAESGPTADTVDATGNSTINVNGSGSALNVPVNCGQIAIGGSMPANLTIANSGSVSSGSIFTLGDQASGTDVLTISSGGTLTSPVTEIGIYAGATSVVTVNGAGSTLTASTGLSLGGYESTGGTGTLTVSNGGVVNAGAVTFYSSASSINISGGTLTSGSLSSFNTGYGSINLIDPAGGYALNINGSSGTTTYSGSISGTGSVNKSGGSDQILSGNNTFTGTVQVTGGTLELGTASANTYRVNGAVLQLDSPLTGNGSVSLTDPTDDYALVLYSVGGAGTFSGIISGTGSINAAGTTTQILSGPNTFTGSLLVNGGTLAISNTNMFTSLASGAGTFQINPGGSFPATTPITLYGGTISYNTASGTLANPFYFLSSSDSTIQVLTATTTLTLTRPLSGPSGMLTTSGPGTLNLALSNSSSNSISTLQLNGGTTLISSGTLSLVSTTSALDVTNSSSLNISGGAVVNATQAASFFGANITIEGNSSALVTGSGSQLNASNVNAFITVGGTTAPGTLSVTMGGSVSVPGLLTVGYGLGGTGSGVLTVGSGGSVTGGLTEVGADGTTGTATITGAGSVLNAPGALYLASGGGTGTVIVSNGGVVNTANTELFTSTSSINISGGTLNTGILTLIGGATVSISNGGTANASSTATAVTVDGNGSISITGTGSALNCSGQFNLGGGMPGTLTVANSSTATIVSLYAGDSASGTDLVLLNTGGTVNAPTTVLGTVNGSTGRATVLGNLNALTALDLGGDPAIGTAGRGAISIQSAGLVNAGQVTFYSQTSTIGCNGGALVAGSLSSFITGYGVLSLISNPTAGGFAATINDPSAADTNIYSGSITGIGSLNKSGGSTQILAGTDTFTGLTLVTGGMLILSGTNRLGSMNISGGTVQLTGIENVLSLTSSLTIGSAGRLDLTTDSMNISGGSLSAITALAKLGYNNGTWNGSGGITSSSAATNSQHLTAVGVIQNNQSGSALYNASHPFHGVIPGTSDILAAYAYYGDANLDGRVDGSDYSRIDAAYLADRSNPTAMTGWFNGDFNYDGVINGSDYTLIDNAFNTQGAQLSTETASPTAELSGLIGTSVPEPATLYLVVVGISGLLGRRARRRQAMPR